jgi:hypothetical protein
MIHVSRDAMHRVSTCFIGVRGDASAPASRIYNKNAVTIVHYLLQKSGAQDFKIDTKNVNRTFAP